VNTCNVEDLWGGFFAGSTLAGFVAFDIFNQAPPSPSDDDGSTDFALASAMANGLGNAGVGEKFHFLFDTVFVNTLATAQGHGFLFVSGDTATFLIAGHGDQPGFGMFQGIAGPEMFQLDFPSSGMSGTGVVGLTHCRGETVEECQSQGE
jgi:hypothetical protein